MFAPPSPVPFPYAFCFFLSLYCRPAAWLEGGMNAPPPHHNQYQYHHPQYQGGPSLGHPGGYSGWPHTPQQQRFGAEAARRAAGAAVGATATAAKDDKTSPFVSTVHSHPGFQPQKIGKGAGAVSRVNWVIFCVIFRRFRNKSLVFCAVVLETYVFTLNVTKLSYSFHCV